MSTALDQLVCTYKLLHTYSTPHTCMNLYCLWVTHSTVCLPTGIPLQWPYNPFTKICSGSDKSVSDGSLYCSFVVNEGCSVRKKSPLQVELSEIWTRWLALRFICRLYKKLLTIFFQADILHEFIRTHDISKRHKKPGATLSVWEFPLLWCHMIAKTFQITVKLIIYSTIYSG